jgi:serine/threonine protein phosphatase PrpC
MTEVNSEQLMSQGLELLGQYTVPEFREAMETLLVYTKNLIDHPEERKFRKVKRSNIHFQERLGRFNGALEVMNALGFFENGDYLRYTDDLTEDRLKLLGALKTTITERRDQANSAFDSLPVRLPADHKYSSVSGAAAHGEIGRRQDMEDDDLIIDQFSGAPSSGFFGLYDGHGGRETVDFVVKTLHLNFEQELRTDPTLEVPEAFKRSYLTTDGQLRRHNILRSGTTAVTCLIRIEDSGDRILYSANVGDSRAILCRNGQALRLTVDHKATLPEEAKRVRDAGGYVGRNQRVNGILAISRALGDHMLKENNVVSAEPYCTTTPLNAETDNFLILACDGVWDVMSDQEAVDFVLANYETEKKAQESGAASAAKDENDILLRLANGLIRKALDLRSLDNISVCCVKL